MENITAEKIQLSIQKRYAEVASRPQNQFNYLIGKEGALALKYDPAWLKTIPDIFLASFCGVGNPFLLGEIPPEATLLDIGCGAGVDLMVARHFTGSKGKVCGIDLTPQMVEKSRAHFQQLAIENVEVLEASSEQIPYHSEVFDRIISNGVLNLSFDKAKSFSEIYRVLKSGGCLQFADIVLKADLPAQFSLSLKAWSD